MATHTFISKEMTTVKYVADIGGKRHKEEETPSLQTGN